MVDLRIALQDYLRVRRRLGFELKAHERLLNGFVDFVERVGTPRITTEPGARVGEAASRCPPALLAQTSGDGARVRPVCGDDRPLKRGARRRSAARHPAAGGAIHLLRRRDRALMAAARALTPSLHAASMQTLNGLMATTGLRLGETLGLDRRDVDLHDGALHVRAAKQQKQREVPLHPTTTEALRGYARLRDRLCPRPDTAACFLSPQGRRLHKTTVHRLFPRLIREVGLEGRGHRARPRPHDIRHAYAVKTLLGWHRSGEEVERQLPLLATFLGHAHPASSYWYLEAVPELLQLVGRRLDGVFGEMP